jgi:hypothetical protein
MDPTDPIRRVPAVSTGQVQIRPDHLRDATAMINTMRLGNPGLVILPAHDLPAHDLPAHDLAAASRLAQATGRVPTLTTA